MNHTPHLLVIGVGSIGERHVRCFQSTKRCTLTLCEPIEERRTEISDRYSVPGYSSWEEAIEKEAFSGAIIASPAPYHIPTARALTERGLDLLIEKPLSLSLEGIHELRAEVKSKGSKAAVGFVYRSLPALRELREAACSGDFGRIVQVNIQAGQNFPFYRPAYREIYYADPAMGGGLIQDMLPHPLNALEWIAGATTRVVVDAEHQVLDGVEVEDTVHLLTRHRDILGSITVNQYQPVNEFVITVHCESASLRWELQKHRWLIAREMGGDWEEQNSFHHERDDFYTLQANAFLDFLEGSAPPSCSLDAGIQTLQSTLAILDSWKSQQWIDVPPLPES